MIEFLMGFMGDKARWRTMPWMVMFFGILVVPLGVVGITLIVPQPIAVGAWCAPCLIAAAAMLVMIALTLDEVAAMLQFLVQARRADDPDDRKLSYGVIVAVDAKLPIHRRRFAASGFRGRLAMAFAVK